jgi:mono/diheme cytochrome c family protein
VLLAGCHWPGKPNPAERPVPENQVVKFDKLYGRHCAGCHGADGRLGPAPPLNDPLFRAGIPEKELERVIRSGRPGTPMTAFAREKGGWLTPAQIQVLVYEIKGVRYRVTEERNGEAAKPMVVRDASGIAPKWGVPPTLGTDVPPYRPPRPASDGGGAGDRERGAKVFARACADCHGEKGLGFEKGGRRLQRINDPAFLALISDQALRRYAITGRPDLGMPDYAGARPGAKDFRPLTPREVTDLVAFLAGWRRGGSPGGK